MNRMPGSVPSEHTGAFVQNIILLGLILTGIGCASPKTESRQSEPVARGEVVVLMHGLARTDRSMRRLEKALTEEGYAVASIRYPSRKKTVQQIAAEDLAPVVNRWRATNPRAIHFVAHSLGNIVIRQYFASTQLDRAGRIVMLAPPNQGSEVVDKLGNFVLFDWINGPAGKQLGTSDDSLPNRLPTPPVDVGVIAGTRSINWILSTLIPGHDDGKVSVERTRLAGMIDFATVDSAHPFLMRNAESIALTLTFLRYGTFHPATPGPEREEGSLIPAGQISSPIQPDG